jgi:hypothetical protein
MTLRYARLCTHTGMILSLVALTLFFASCVLWMRYAYTKPVSSNAAVGRVYALNTQRINRLLE